MGVGELAVRHVERARPATEASAPGVKREVTGEWPRSCAVLLVYDAFVAYMQSLSEDPQPPNFEQQMAQQTCSDPALQQMSPSAQSTLPQVGSGGGGGSGRG